MSEGQAFWEERWREGRIGFHEGRVNEHLLAEWPRLGLRGDEGVLVPLCGKAQDLIWLAAQGHRVVGVEFSEMAVAAFFAEQKLTPRRGRIGGLDTWSADSLTIFRADFFEVQPEHLAQACGGAAPLAWWDRAALVALPAATRRAYAERLAALLPATARGLLLVLEYAQEQMAGPPFAVPEAEVHSSFGPPRFAPPQLLKRVPLEISAERRALGVTSLQDVLWRVIRSRTPMYEFPDRKCRTDIQLAGGGPISSAAEPEKGSSGREADRPGECAVLSSHKLAHRCATPY